MWKRSAVRGAGLTLGLLVLGACENVPYYGESQSWFSRSQYDPEIQAIERKIPPPEQPFSPAADAGAAAPGYVRVAGGYLRSAPPPDVQVYLGSSPVATPAEADRMISPRVEGATIYDPPAPPPLGYSRQRRVIYGTNRGPFRASGMRSLR